MERFEPIVKTYYDALEEGRILARKCSRCGAVNYPPMPVCQACCSTDTEWTQMNPGAKLLEFNSMADSHVWAHLRDLGPIYWGEVALDDGPSLTGIVLGIADPEALRARLPVPVKAEIIQDDGFKTVLFRLVNEDC